MELNREELDALLGGVRHRCLGRRRARRGGAARGGRPRAGRRGAPAAGGRHRSARWLRRRRGGPRLAARRPARPGARGPPSRPAPRPTPPARRSRPLCCGNASSPSWTGCLTGWPTTTGSAVTSLDRPVRELLAHLSAVLEQFATELGAGSFEAPADAGFDHWLATEPHIAALTARPPADTVAALRDVGERITAALAPMPADALDAPRPDLATHSRRPHPPAVVRAVDAHRRRAPIHRDARCSTPILSASAPCPTSRPGSSASGWRWWGERTPASRAAWC